VEGPGGDDREAPVMYGPGWKTLRTEPTESLRNGIPRDAYLTMSSASRDVIYASSSSQPMMTGEQEISGLAWSMASRERPDLFPWATQQPVWDRFKMGKSQDFKFVLRFTPEL